MNTSTRISISLLLILSLTYWTVQPVHAGDDSMGFTTYYFTDSGDNSVITTSFNLAKNLLERTMLLIDIELDNVTIPPVTAVTGATRPQRRAGEPFEKNRAQVILGVEQGLGTDVTLGANAYRSQEVDYVSNSVIGTYSQNLFDQNSTIVLRGQYNHDLVGEVLDDGSVLNKPKDQYTAVAALSQILSPNTVLDISYDHVITTGFQSDPYRQVSVRGDDGVVVKTDELHPSDRTRQAGTARISQMVPRIQASLIGSYRYYFDSWAVHSHTASFRLNKYLFRSLILGLDYRYYTQTGSYFAQDEYAGQEYLAGAYRTADYKLRPFSSNNVGFSLTYLFRGLAESSPDLGFLENSAFELIYFRYFNDQDFSADILQASLKFSL